MVIQCFWKSFGEIFRTDSESVQVFLEKYLPHGSRLWLSNMVRIPDLEIAIAAKPLWHRSRNMTSLFAMIRHHMGIGGSKKVKTGETRGVRGHAPPPPPPPPPGKSPLHKNLLRVLWGCFRHHNYAFPHQILLGFAKHIIMGCLFSNHSFIQYNTFILSTTYTPEYEYKNMYIK